LPIINYDGYVKIYDIFTETGVLQEVRKN